MTTPIAIVYPSQFADFKKHAKAFAYMLASYSEEKPLSGFKAPDELAKAIKYKSHDDLLRIGKQRALADKQEPLNLFEPDSMTRTSIIEHFVGIGYIEEIIIESVKNLSVSIAVRNAVGTDGLETIMKGVEVVIGDFDKLVTDLNKELEKADADKDLTSEVAVSYTRMVLTTHNGANELLLRSYRMKNKPLPAFITFDVTDLNAEQRFNLAKWRNVGLSFHVHGAGSSVVDNVLTYNGKEGLFTTVGLDTVPPAKEGTLKVECEHLLSPFTIGLKKDLITNLPGQALNIKSRCRTD